MSKFQSLLDKLGIDESQTKSIPKEKAFTKVKDNVTLIKGFNQQMDLLFLPTAQLGYKYLLTVVDLATNEFDVEPIKNKEPDTILKAYKKMFHRGYIDKAKATVTTDGGSEFKGEFNDWLKEEGIFHRTTLADRHKQNANVESLNRQLGRFINGYLNAKEVKSGKIQKNWIGTLDTIRDELNKVRKKKVPNDINSYEYPIFNNTKTIKKGKKEIEIEVEPKFKIGQFVQYKSEVPLTALGKKQNSKVFREGDVRWSPKPRRIKRIYYYSGDIPYRYGLENMPNVSYTENELKPSLDF